MKTMNDGGSSMTPKEKAKLERHGFVEMSIQQFLGLSDAEMELIELRVEVNAFVVDRAAEQGLTPAALAKSASLLARDVKKALRKDPDVPFDHLFACFFALGGRRADLAKRKNPKKKKPLVPAR